MSESGALPTSISVREIRADALYRIVAKRRPERTENIAGLGDVFSWPSVQVQVAICDLCHDGRLEEDAHGRLIIRRTAR